MELAWDRKVGQGAFADVWLATDILGRPVAVKFFADTDSAQLERNAIDHAKALVRVEHPSVVRVYAVENQTHPDSGREALAVVMEYVPGNSLAMHKSPIDTAHSIRIIEDILGAIDAIHKAGLVHGDLHEANILITSEGAKVIDILYTHSLAQVGTTSAMRTRADDTRALAVMIRLILVRAGASGLLLEEAYFRATQATFVDDVRTAYAEFLVNGQNSSPSQSLPSKAAVATARLPAERLMPMLTAIQSKRTSLASCVTEVLAVAIEARDESLRLLCERELSGYYSKSQSKGISPIPDSEYTRHRQVQFYTTLGVQVNMDYFGTGQNAIRWMRSDTEHFRPFTLLYPQPISEIEQQLSRPVHGDARHAHYSRPRCWLEGRRSRNLLCVRQRAARHRGRS